jgi:hypothetical protein
MNELTKFLIQELLDTPKTVAIYGGGFKPPTKGHFTVVEKALSDFPEIDEFKIFVGSGVRDGITQEESIKIWEFYKPYLSNKINIEPSAAPVKSILGYAKDHPDEKVYWVLGTREGNEDDLKDIENRTKSLSKYPNIEVVVINTQGGVSGTNTRVAIKNNDKELFFKLIPDVKEKEQIWGLVSPVIKENQNKAWNLQEGMLSLSKYMIDNGMNIKPLPKVKMIKNNKENADNMLGNTAYYNPTEKSITLFTLNRHPKDILRSFSHEMVHHMQNLEGRLSNIQTTNTNEDGDLPEIEEEAYKLGNMMLRNWEDSIKNV